MAIINQVSRRGFLHLSGLAVTGMTLSACAIQPPSAFSNSSVVPAVGSNPLAFVDPAESPVANPDEALQRLMEGNLRYTGNKSIPLHESENRRIEVAKGQHPFAAIFSCVDSRVPPEMVFDRGLGDLFVIRTAGHVIDKAVLGSLEFGMAELKIPLLMVLGHEKCGAVKATIETVEKNETAPDEIQWLVEGIHLAVDKVKGHTGDLLNNAVIAHVELTVDHLKNTPILAKAIARGQLKIVGAEYRLDSGVVEITVP